MYWPRGRVWGGSSSLNAMLVFLVLLIIIKKVYLIFIYFSQFFNFCLLAILFRFFLFGLNINMTLDCAFLTRFIKARELSHTRAFLKLSKRKFIFVFLLRVNHRFVVLTFHKFF